MGSGLKHKGLDWHRLAVDREKAAINVVNKHLARLEVAALLCEVEERAVIARQQHFEHIDSRNVSADNKKVKHAGLCRTGVRSDHEALANQSRVPRNDHHKRALQDVVAVVVSLEAFANGAYRILVAGASRGVDPGPGALVVLMVDMYNNPTIDSTAADNVCQRTQLQSDVAHPPQVLSALVHVGGKAPLNAADRHERGVRSVQRTVLHERERRGLLAAQRVHDVERGVDGGQNAQALRNGVAGAVGHDGDGRHGAPVRRRRALARAHAQQREHQLLQRAVAAHGGHGGELAQPAQPVLANDVGHVPPALRVARAHAQRRVAQHGAHVAQQPRQLRARAAAGARVDDEQHLAAGGRRRGVARRPLAAAAPQAARVARLARAARRRLVVPQRAVRGAGHEARRHGRLAARVALHAAAAAARRRAVVLPGSTTEPRRRVR
ncbi:hypothetical protein FGB62_4g053 [Gracilaria domingensis]|nr:hypothetical protein FGB62_4g053 [Gracilaria domingensis]